jgi:type II secretory pathway component PulM
MRSFDDERGGHWQAALMEASFGNVLLVLSRIGAPDVLQAALDSANFHEAEDWLAAASEDQLRTMLAEARPWG